MKERLCPDESGNYKNLGRERVYTRLCEGL
jgi:hypothetical protein